MKIIIDIHPSNRAKFLEDPAKTAKVLATTAEIVLRAGLVTVGSLGGSVGGDALRNLAFDLTEFTLTIKDGAASG